jgi:F0F1-type ATP synthase membrane subunit b/b'
MTLNSIALLSLATPLLAHAVPNVFVDGQRTSADQMNRNFEYLEELNSRQLTSVQEQISSNLEYLEEQISSNLEYIEEQINSNIESVETQIETTNSDLELQLNTNVEHLEEQHFSLNEQFETLSQLIADVANSQTSYSAIIDSNTYSSASVYAYANGDIFEPNNLGYGFSTFVIECSDEEYLVPYFLTGINTSVQLDSSISQNIVTSSVDFIATHTLQDVTTPVPLRIFDKQYLQPSLNAGVFETTEVNARTVAADLGACGVMTYDQPIIIDPTYSTQSYSQADFATFIGQFRRVK